MTGTRSLLLCCLFTACIIFCSGRWVDIQGQSSEYMLKAGFMERFTRFIEWPADSIQADTTKPFIILVLGNNHFGDNLKKFFTKTRIKDRRVTIRIALKLDTNHLYHMIFIGSNLSGEIMRILKYTQNKPIITVGETIGFGKQGVLINFYLENNKIRFEINQEAFKKSGLRVSHLLLSAAKII